MSQISNQEVALALSKLSSLLVKEGVVRHKHEEEALMVAMESVAHKLAITESPKSQPLASTQSKAISSKEFVQNTFSRMNAKYTQSQNKLEEQRHTKYIEEISCLQDRPNINPLSKKLYYSRSPPIYDRVEDVISQKKEYMQQLQEDAGKKKKAIEDRECTFQPEKKHRSRRSSREFTEQCYSWNKRREEELEKEHKLAEDLKVAEVKQKPTLNPKSQKLAEQRAKTPILERLQERGRTEKPPQPTFRPAINERSAGLKLGNVTERLYGSRHSSVTDESPRRNSGSPKKSIEKVSFSLGNSYKINVNKGASTDREVNEIRYTAGLEFLMRTIR
ncbi:unnamed protein product [Blepharisma stoltei]|uniref:Uncharacterized protein n=1 Tax=Blepharisma stoltei TaxID=1481888 RepID=A0AAU9I543_9CILI|nr:unnamed protein product [Blepharisma stoltei]